MIKPIQTQNSISSQMNSFANTENSAKKFKIIKTSSNGANFGKVLAGLGKSLTQKMQPSSTSNISTHKWSIGPVKKQQPSARSERLGEDTVEVNNRA